MDAGEETMWEINHASGEGRSSQAERVVIGKRQ